MRFVVMWSLIALVVAGLAFVVSHRRDDGGHARAPQVTDPLPGTAGMRVSLQPESGDLVAPTPQQQKAELDEALSRSTEGLYEEVLPNGAVKVHLQGRFQSASVAVVDDDGTLHTRCGSACRHANLEEK